MSAQHEAARAYAERGWPVFPLRPRSKVPLTEHGLKDASTDLADIDAWWALYPDANVAIVTGVAFDVLDLDGPDAVTRFNAWCADEDVDPASLRGAVSRTSKGWHYLFAPCGVGNRAKLLGAPIDWRGKGGYIAAPPSVHPSGHVYEWRVSPNGALPPVPAALRDLLAPPARPAAPAPTLARTDVTGRGLGYAHAAYAAEIDLVKNATEGHRNHTLFTAACNLLEFVNGGHLDPGVLDELAAAAACTGLTETEIDRTLISAHTKTQGKARDVPAPKTTPAAKTAPRRAPPADELPATVEHLHPDPAMFHGLLGEIARTVDPWTEADPVGVLVSLLAGVGCCIGAGPHALISTTKHPLLVWPLLLGPTSSGRKGTAQDVAEAVIAEAQPEFILGNVVGGLSSGEGLIHLVRDAKYGDAETEDGRKLLDAGVDDKRRWIVESEYGGTMARAKREGSSLSAVLRQAWDGKVMATLTKTSVTATAPHLVISGHITAAEFLARVRETDMAGGTYNRFLPVLVRRSKLLPEAAPMPHDLLKGFGQTLRERMCAARTAGWVPRTAEAAALWRGTYAELNEERQDSDRLGQFIARAAPYTVRLSVLFALVDGARHVDVPHLQAATALMRYSIESIRRLLASPDDDRVGRLIGALHQVGEAGMTRSDVSALFGRNLTAPQLDALLEQVPGLEVDRVSTGGRAAVRYVIPPTKEGDGRDDA